MTISFIKNSIINGARVIGQSHVANHSCCQDYYKIYKTKYGVALAVCDGVGSNRYSQYGAKAACKAIGKVFDLYYRHAIEKDDIGVNIEKYYNEYTKPKYRNSASTTCLFVMIYNHSEIIIGQAGDGVILIKANDKFIVFKRKNDDFENEVVPLSCGKQYTNWKIKTLKFDFNTSHQLNLLLSTDGISEDIIPEKMENFFDYFINLTHKNHDKKLLKELKHWSAPGSIDDKTVITFSWRKPNE